MSEQVQAMADAAQADYFRFQLQQERSELESMLAKQTKSLTRCMAESAIWRGMSWISVRTI